MKMHLESCLEVLWQGCFDIAFGTLTAGLGDYSVAQRCSFLQHF